MPIKTPECGAVITSGDVSAVTMRSGQDRSSKSRMSVPTSSISADTRSDRPMWCTYITSMAMLVSTNT